MGLRLGRPPRVRVVKLVSLSSSFGASAISVIMKRRGHRAWKIRRVRHIAFDLDNCLVDTDVMHYVVLNRALEPYGTQITWDEHLAVYKGRPTKTKLLMLAGEGRISSGAILDIHKCKQMLTKEAIGDTVHPSSEVHTLLSELAYQEYRMCVCSNCVRESVNMLADAAGITGYMDFMLSTAEVPERPKPFPDMYMLAAKQWEICPGHMIVVEDGEQGIKAGQRAGCVILEVGGPTDLSIDMMLPRIEQATTEIMHRGCVRCK